MISLNGKRRGILKFNEKIKLLRSEKGLTQEELSKRLRVSNRSYISWEKGESVPRDLRVYLELTKVFSVSLDYLLLGISNDDDMARTALGQKKFHSSKLTAGTIFNALIYLLMMLSYLAIVYLALGGDGLKTSFQIDMAFSPGNLTYKKVILIQIIGGFIGCLALGSLAMLVSSKSKKSKIALTIMISSFAIYGLLDIFIRPESKLIQYIMNLSPCGIGQVFFQLPFLNYIHLGLVMWLPYVMLIFGLVQLIVYDYLTVKLNR